MPRHLHDEDIGSVFGVRRTANQSFGTSTDTVIAFDGYDDRFERDRTDAGLTLNTSTGVITNTSGGNLTVAISLQVVTSGSGATGTPRNAYLKIGSVANDDRVASIVVGSVLITQALNSSATIKIANNETITAYLWSATSGNSILAASTDYRSGYATTMHISIIE